MGLERAATTAPTHTCAQNRAANKTNAKTPWIVEAVVAISHISATRMKSAIKAAQLPVLVKNATMQTSLAQKKTVKLATKTSNASHNSVIRMPSALHKQRPKKVPNVPLLKMMRPVQPSVVWRASALTRLCVLKL